MIQGPNCKDEIDWKDGNYLEDVRLIQNVDLVYNSGNKVIVNGWSDYLESHNDHGTKEFTLYHGHGGNTEWAGTEVWISNNG